MRDVRRRRRPRGSEAGSAYLPEEDHPVRFALINQVVRGHQVDQVQVAVEQQRLQAFGEVFVEDLSVGQIHRG